MKRYEAYLDNSFGIAPAIGQPSFNNVLYSMELMLGRKINGKLDHRDESYLHSHVQQNKDKNGLYAPKNSHDNMTALCCYSTLFMPSNLKQMSWLTMVKETNIIRIWDTIFYSYLKAPKLIKIVLYPLVFVTLLQIVQAIIKKVKIRPKLHERIWWTITGKEYTLRYYQNDGKILGLLKLLCLKRNGFGWIIPIFKRLYIKRLSKEYMYVMMYNYFQDKTHPIIREWKQAAVLERDPLEML